MPPIGLLSVTNSEPLLNEHGFGQKVQQQKFLKPVIKTPHSTQMHAINKWHTPTMMKLVEEKKGLW